MEGAILPDGNRSTALIRVVRVALLAWAGVFGGLGLPGDADARLVSITILCTSDICGHLGAASGGKSGLLGLAPIIERETGANRNLLLVDCGGLLHGDIESYPSHGGVMLKALRRLGYDAWIPGRHAWDFGVKNLCSLIAHSGVTVLAGNLRVGSVGNLRAPPHVQDYLVREFDGVRVALIGLTDPDAPRWFPPGYLSDFTFVDEWDALRGIMPRTRSEGAAVTVVVMRRGLRSAVDRFSPPNRVAKMFPTVDVILGGGTHRFISGRRMGEAVYLQAGCCGRAMGEVKLLYDTTVRRLVRQESYLLQRGASDEQTVGGVPGDMAGDVARISAFMRRVVGHAGRRFSSRQYRPGQSEIQQLVCSAMAEAVKADVVIQGLYNDEELETGPVRAEDVWRIVPYEDKIGVIYLDAAALRGVLGENARNFGGRGVLGIWGLQYELGRDAEGRLTVGRLKLRGSALNGRRRLRVAVNSYLLSPGDGRYAALRSAALDPHARMHLTHMSVREALLRYLEKHDEVLPRRSDDGACGEDVTIVQ